MVFPEFMFRPGNKIPASQQNTPDIEGYYYTANDGSQMAFWIYKANRVSREHQHDYDEYMHIFSVVFQDFNLFDFPLDEVIAASTDVDSERVRKVIDMVGLRKRVDEMPDKEHSLLGNENGTGVGLSGGEAQKVAIARALYKGAPFVILDEPTAALDPVAEAEVYENFDKLVGDKTSIYISHRMSSCKFCDRIVVLDGGKIVEEGKHNELIEHDGIYAKLYNTQAAYYTA